MVFNILGDTVDFKLGLMNSDLRVGSGDGIYFAVSLFLLEDGSFADADSELNSEGETLVSVLETWGERIFSLKRFLSIIISKSMSTFLPLARL